MQSKTGFVLNGVHYVSWLADEYANFGQPIGNATSAMDALAAIGVSWVSLLVTWYQPNVTATSIAPDAQKSPTDAALTYAVQQLHARGLKVMLKPHVDGADGSWRGQFNPTETSAWFNSYNDFIVRYAQFAQSLGVEAFVIGTELKLLSNTNNETAWRAIIANIRSKYSGLLTYAANATGPDDEFAHVAFWDALDLVGLNGYFPLTGSDTPAVDEIVSAWSDNVNGVNLVQIVQDVHAATSKPVIFTEVGYRSAKGANRTPWEWQSDVQYDATEQSNCYEAFFEAWNPNANWMQGAFWWAWPITPPNPNDTGYSPQGKPASQILGKWFGASSATTD